MKKVLFVLFALCIGLVGKAESIDSEGMKTYTWSPNSTFTTCIDVQLPNSDVVSFCFEYSGNHIWWQGSFFQNLNNDWYTLSYKLSSPEYPDGIYPSIIDYNNPWSTSSCDFLPNSHLESESDFSTIEVDDADVVIDIRNPYTNQILKTIKIGWVYPIGEKVVESWAVYNP